MPVWDQLATDQFDPWQVVPRQEFTSNSCLLISAVFVIVSCVGCHKGSNCLPFVVILRKIRRKKTITFNIISILLCYGKCYILISNWKLDNKV